MMIVMMMMMMVAVAKEDLKNIAAVMAMAAGIVEDITDGRRGDLLAVTPIYLITVVITEVVAEEEKEDTIMEGTHIRIIRRVVMMTTTTIDQLICMAIRYLQLYFAFLFRFQVIQLQIVGNTKLKANCIDWSFNQTHARIILLKMQFLFQVVELRILPLILWLSIGTSEV
eukprot:TRINITY_DN7741_c0_g4_i1.p3 TRINITY_DN7741_c0_g4~~TRINITY_DN7741_c0_g4_i1.p3  ORF type:complete len:170 (-),score=23.30 TRINITY_DN7741_c0_g4_i1:113-622(-)